MAPTQNPEQWALFLPSPHWEDRALRTIAKALSPGGGLQEEPSLSTPGRGGGDEIEKPWRFRLETRWWKRHPRRERPNRPWKGLGPLPASAPAPFPHPHPPIPAHRDSHLASNWGTPGPHAFAHRVLGWWREWL